MTDNNTWIKLEPLLPADRITDRPLFMILAILAFLATLTLLSVKTSYQSAGEWRAQLGSTASVQIKPGANTDPMASANQARDILLKSPQVSAVTILPKEKSQELLRPWLGDVDLPEDLPLPILLSVELKKGQHLDVEQLRAALTEAGFDANIDDHNTWSQDIKRTVGAARIISVLAFFLIFIAIIAALIFATNAGISSRQKLMSVLQQVGAAPAYTARLFSARFSLTSLKAGLVGAFGALLILFLISLLFTGTLGAKFFLPGFKGGLSDIYMALTIPVFMAVIAALTTWRTVMKSLLAEMYS